MGTATMAKKKATRGKLTAERKAIAVTLKASPEWKTWVEGLADHLRTDVAKAIDRALIMLAKSEGYDSDAPRR